MKFTITKKRENHRNKNNSKPKQNPSNQLKIFYIKFIFLYARNKQQEKNLNST